LVWPDLADAVVSAFWDDARAELAELYRRPMALQVAGW
jgi:hypothetical protein